MEKYIDIEYQLHVLLECNHTLLNQVEILLNRVDQQTIAPTTEWLDGNDVCRILKICPRTLQVYCNKNILPFRRLGGTVFFSKTDIEATLEAKKF